MTRIASHIKNQLAPFFVVLLILLPRVTSSQAEVSPWLRNIEKATVVIHCSYAPVTFFDEKTHQPAGFAVDVIDNVAERAGLEVSYICKNGWPEMISAIVSGEADISVLLQSSEREKIMLFSSHIDITYLSYFARSQSPIDFGLLPGQYTVGVIRGSRSLEHLKTYPGVHLALQENYQTGIFRLLAGEIDVFAAEESLVFKHAREMRLEDRITKIGKPFAEQERGLVVSKSNSALLEKLNANLKGFVGSPEYQRIYVKWYGTPVPYWTSKKILFIAGVSLFVIVCSMAFWRYRSISNINKELVRTIEERKRSEAALRESEKKLLESQRIAHIGNWEHDLSTGKVAWSDELFRILGFDPKTEAADFQRFFERVHPDDRESLKKAIDDSLRDYQPFTTDYRYIPGDGTIKFVNAQAHLVREETGDRMILRGTGQDITERKLVEEKIRKSEQFTRTILDTVDEGFIVIDSDFRILTANKAYCNQASLPCDEVIGKHCYEVSHHSSHPCHELGEECAVRLVFNTGQAHTALHKHPDHNGQVLFVETKAFPLKDDAGRVMSVIETINNITEKRLLEEERLKSQKLEAIGTLAGGIAHDFNNLLQGVFGYISLAKLRRNDAAKSLGALEEAEKALHLSVKLTSQLLTFSKGGKPLKKPIDLKPVIANAAQFALSGSSSSCRMALDNGLYQVEADEGQISQVIQNIVLNADQAMPGGGQVEITANNIPASAPAPPQGLEKRSYIVITIRDSGVGIAKEHQSRIFDPYFTTKEKGSGLGLATSYSIIKNHSGLIEAASEEGKGATFRVYLPAVAAKADDAKIKPSASGTPAGRTGRVLVMDDDPIVRDVAGELIRTLGHDVDFASHGWEAIDKYQKAREDGKPFDVVLLDLTIRGGMGGAETMQKLLAIDSAVKAVVSSGYSESATLSSYRDQGFKAFLQKPYDADGLHRTLSSIFDK